MKLEAPMVAVFPLLVCILLMNTFSMNFTTAQSTPFPARVGVVVDMDSDVGKMRLSCIEMAISDYYTRHGYYQTKLVLDKRDVVGAAAAAVVNHISYLNVQCNLEIHDEIVARSDRKKADTYDELLYAVHQGKFDAAVGDVTILANRSQYVNFTLPYTEAGISSNKTKNACVLLKPQPLTWKLWLICFCSFIFMGFLIWILELWINEDFRGPLWHQVGTIFLFASSTKLISNLSRLLLIIWLLVVLILTLSYAASLTSILTVVQELQPTITDVNELIRNKENVCYRNGSFVFGAFEKYEL
ncbi:glutamate receptor 2.7-like [Salvia miltiorrhiza]|uniref:glutamate receptor 2.7-like n=1 Tax=Salvia miltiorrhiza TaxID=226208 RepID=UPI0025ACE8B9|nr:glutamate receptor 2.7-like [Salvia miltiorrhiza]